MARHTVLVTSAGTIVAQGITKSLRLASLGKGSQVDYRIVAVDMSPSAVGLYRSDLGVRVPPASSPEYIDAMVRVCREEAVEAVMIGSDEELLPLSKQADRVKQESGAVVVADQRAIAIGKDKWRTFEFMKKNSLPCAESALPEDSDSFLREFGFPVVVKPREGHGSVQVHIVNDRPEMKRAISDIRNAGLEPLLQEHLPESEHEFTSGVTTDPRGRKVTSSITMKRKLKNGQTHVAFVDDFLTVRKAAETAALKMGAKGPINIQARLSGEVPKAFEVNPRFSASCPIRSAAGVNEPDIIFRNWVLKENVSVGSYRKLVCLRYLNEVYLPGTTYEGMAAEGRTEGESSFTLDYF